MISFRLLLLGGRFFNEGHVWEKTDADRAKPVGKAGPSFYIHPTTTVEACT